MKFMKVKKGLGVLLPIFGACAIFAGTALASDSVGLSFLVEHNHQN
jgi:hypothetical protein